MTIIYQPLAMFQVLNWELHSSFMNLFSYVCFVRNVVKIYSWRSNAESPMLLLLT